MNEAERREFLTQFIEKVEIYEEEQANGQWLKSIEFKLPIISKDMKISLDNGSQTENGRYTRKCCIIETRSGFAVLEFQNGALERLKLSRLYATEEEAQAAIPAHKQNSQENFRHTWAPWE